MSHSNSCYWKLFDSDGCTQKCRILQAIGAEDKIDIIEIYVWVCIAFFYKVEMII